MADNAGMTIRPAEVEDIGRQIDDLADRMHRVMTAEAPTLTVTPSGADEVSQRVAATLNQVHTSYSVSARQGLDELHETAATLRAHSTNIAAFDDALEA